MGRRTTVIMMPGYQDSDPGHWQSIWCRDHPEFVRIMGLAWDRPDRRSWVAALDEAVRSASGPVVLVGHSLGSVTIASWALDVRRTEEVQAALLVAPCDTEQSDFTTDISGFSPMPTGRLPFRSVLVASRADPWIAFSRAEAMAAGWGARLVDAGEAGHLNVAAGYGPWAAGEALLAELLAAG